MKKPALITALAPLGLLIALTLVPAGALGGQPVTQTLTPAPPSFLTCKTVGSGTICQGSRTFTVDPHPDFVCGNGDVIFDQGTVRQVVIRYYDTNGNLTRRVIHEFWSDAQKSNPRTGATAPYTQASNITDVLAVPGDLGSATETVTGQGNITVPGLGAVLLNAGRIVFGADGTLEFSAGPQFFIDYFVNGNTAALDELCSALGAT
jgi:hypothetical protein